MLTGNKHLPKKPFSNDIFLVEYPKSGITWLCFLISNSIITNENNNSIKVTFFNIQQLISDVQISRDVPINNLWNTNTPRFIKSHYEYKHDYNNIIYLVRDPLSVMTSYYKYLLGLKKIKCNFLDFVKSKEYGVNKWIDHVNSWTKNIKNGQRLHIIKYEDLISNPQITLENLFNNLGIKISSGAISESIKLSSLTEMKKQEKIYRTHNPFYSLNFVRKGGNNNEGVDPIVKNYVEFKTNEIKHKLKL